MRSAHYGSFTHFLDFVFSKYFQNDYEMVPLAPVIAATTFVFIFARRCVSVLRFPYCKTFSAPVLNKFLVSEVANLLTHTLHLRYHGLRCPVWS